MIIPCLQIFDAIMKRQAMATLAKDMDRWIEKRDELSRKMEDIRKQKQTALKREVSKNFSSDYSPEKINI